MDALPIDVISIIVNKLKKYDIQNFVCTSKIYFKLNCDNIVFDKEIIDFDNYVGNIHNRDPEIHLLGLNCIPDFEYIEVTPKYLNFNQQFTDLSRKCLKTHKTMYILTENINQEKLKILHNCKLLYCSIPEQINSLCLPNLKHLVLHFVDFKSILHINSDNLEELYIFCKCNTIDIRINTKKLKTLCIPNLDFSNYLYKKFEQIQNLIIYNTMTEKIGENNIVNLYIACSQIDINLLPTNNVVVYIDYYVLLENSSSLDKSSNIFIDRYNTQYLNFKKSVYSAYKLLLYYPNNKLIKHVETFNNSLLTIEKNDTIENYYYQPRDCNIKHNINKLTLDRSKFNVTDSDIDELTLCTCCSTTVEINNCHINAIFFERSQLDYETEDDTTMNVIISNCSIETLDYRVLGNITICNSKIKNLYIKNIKKKIINGQVDYFDLDTEKEKL